MIKGMPLLTFAAYHSYPEIIHGFTLRSLKDPANIIPAPSVLAELGYAPDSLVQAEQPHGDQVALIDSSHRGKTVPHVDALITDQPGIVLVIRTADCGPVYLYDPDHHAIGLVHSGRKGTEQGITLNCIRMMQQTFSSDPENLIAVLGPCIRPPHYEVDFAADITRQVQDAGIRHFHDGADNTANDLKRFYSYRAEKGSTGRHYAFMGLT